MQKQIVQQQKQTIQQQKAEKQTQAALAANEQKGKAAADEAAADDEATDEAVVDEVAQMAEEKNAAYKAATEAKGFARLYDG